MHFHWQNLNEKGARQGSLFWHGRAWLRFGRENDRFTLRWEWKIPTTFWHIALCHDGDEAEWQVSFACGLVALWISLENWKRFRVPYRRENPYGEHDLRLSWHDGGLWWNVWMNDHISSSRDPKWRRGHFDPLDFLFGRQKYSTQDVSVTSAEVALPEATYPVSVRIFDSTWVRPRWPWWPLTRRMRRANIDVLAEGGIPEPGKGESAWDLDDRATFSMTCPAKTVKEAVARLKTDTERWRLKYGGPDWKPERQRAS